MQSCGPPGIEFETNALKIQNKVTINHDHSRVV